MREGGETRDRDRGERERGGGAKTNGAFSPRPGIYRAGWSACELSDMLSRVLRGRLALTLCIQIPAAQQLLPHSVCPALWESPGSAWSGAELPPNSLQAPPLALRNLSELLYQAGSSKEHMARKRNRELCPKILFHILKAPESTFFLLHVVMSMNMPYQNDSPCLLNWDHGVFASVLRSQGLILHLV